MRFSIFGRSLSIPQPDFYLPMLDNARLLGKHAGIGYKVAFVA
jgi:hypothetical protein